MWGHIFLKKSSENENFVKTIGSCHLWEVFMSTSRATYNSSDKTYLCFPLKLYTFKLIVGNMNN